MIFIINRCLEKKVSLSFEKEVITIKDFKDSKNSKFLFFPLLDATAQKKELGDEILRGELLISTKKPYQKVFSPCSGKVVEVKKMFCPKENKEIDHLVIENNFQNKGSSQVFKPLDYEQSSPAIMLKRIEEAGIVGMGGGLYPTFLKYQDHRKIKEIIVNAVECEPFLEKDENVLKNKLYEVIIGTRILLKVANASQATIAIKKSTKNKKMISFLKLFLQNDQKIKLKVLKNQYPMGWERILVQKISKKHYKKYPIEVGIVVNNVETVSEVASAVTEGKVKLEKKVKILIEKTKEKFDFETYYGTNILEIIDSIEHLKGEQASVLIGNPMSSKGLINFETPILQNCSRILILEKREYKTSPCLRCGSCFKRCPSRLHPIEIMEAFKRKEISSLEDLKIEDCCECGICSFVCPSKIEILDSIIKAKKYRNLIGKRARG